MNDATIAAGSNVLTSQSGKFTDRDVGKSIALQSIGALRKRQTGDVITRALGRETLFTNIIAVDNADRITLGAKSTISGDAIRIVWATDDSKAIQRAIGRASRGDNISISGSCGIGSAGWSGLTLSGHNGPSIVAESGTAALQVLATPTQHLTAGGKSVILLLKAMEAATISGLEIDGNGVDSNLVGLERVTSSRIENNRLHNTGSEIANGVFSIGGRGNVYSGNTAFQCGRGLWIGNNSRREDVELNAKIVRNTIRDNLFSGAGGTLQDSVIESNIIVRNGGSCIPLGSTPIALSRNVSISHNTCEHNLLHGVQSDAWLLDPADKNSERLETASPREIRISDNDIAHNGIDGIMAVYARNWTIANNRIWDNNRHRQRGYAIEIGYASTINVIGNTIFDDHVPPTQTSGVFLSSYDTPFSVRQILIANNTISNQYLYGIHVTRRRSGTSSDIQISQNRLLANGQYGILINEGAQGVKVFKNEAQNNPTADFRTDTALTREFSNKFRTRQQ